MYDLMSPTIPAAQAAGRELYGRLSDLSGGDVVMMSRLTVEALRALYVDLDGDALKLEPHPDDGGRQRRSTSEFLASLENPAPDESGLL